MGTDYAREPLPNTPTTSTIYWRSDTGGNINDSYEVTATYTSDATGNKTETQFTLKSRTLDPKDPIVNSGSSHPDVDMLQRAMIQDLFLDKGRLSSYRIGRYDDAATNGYYTASDFHAPYSPVADEVWNFDKFSLNSIGKFGHPLASKKLALRVVTGIWEQFMLIYSAPNANAVTSADSQYRTWLTSAVSGHILAPTGLIDRDGKALSSVDVLNAFVLHESGGHHSFDLISPLAFNNVNVGEQKSKDGHYYTDDGIGFSQIQPYNAGTDNLYNPADNLARAAEIIDQNINSANNPASTPAERVWWAYYAYNNGGFKRHVLIGSLRHAGDQSALRADDACAKLGLSTVS